MYRVTAAIGNSISIVSSFPQVYRKPIHIVTSNKTRVRKNWKLLLLYSVSRQYNCMISHAMSTISSSISSNDINNHPNSINKIAVGQVCSTSSKFNNLLNVAMCAGWAIQQDNNNKCCSMLFLPECFGFLGQNAEETLNAAELSCTSIKPNPDIVTSKLIDVIHQCSKLSINEIPDNLPKVDDASIDEMKLSLIDALQVIARTSNLWISAGSIHICAENNESVSNNDNTVKAETTSKVDTNNVEAPCRQVYNTHLIIDNQGIIRTKYNKIHLFDVCIPDKVNLQESKTTRPGTELIVCTDSPIGRLGLSVCYDLRFPEMYTELVQKMGAQILLVPSAFTVPTGHAHWHTLLKARAIENQCYVIAAAQYGQHNDKRISYGHSLVVDGWGTIIADAGGMDSQPDLPSIQPKIIICDIDLSSIDSIRERMPIQQHRKNAQF